MTSIQYYFIVIYYLIITLCYYRSLFYFSHRQAQIEENMRLMPQMIADYRKKIYELRQKTRKIRTEEEEYLLATGKIQQQGPSWQIFKDASKRK